jgi:hypothetical protein
MRQGITLRFTEQQALKERFTERVNKTSCGKTFNA